MKRRRILCFVVIIASHSLFPRFLILIAASFLFLFLLWQNGSLLSKCIYLSNDSSCLFSPEDGVDISMLENTKSNSESVLSNAHKSSDVSDACQSDLKAGQNFTFEAQVGFFEVFPLQVYIVLSVYFIANFNKLITIPGFSLLRILSHYS